jgi:hypothetical protein
MLIFVIIVLYVSAVIYLVKRSNKENAMQSGELLVIGSDTYEVELKRHPTSVKVYFEDACEIVPCSPNHFDDLQWDVDTHHGVTTLTISWKVTGERKIIWIAYH